MMIDVRICIDEFKPKKSWHQEKIGREIDDLVYDLYGITDEERKIIEGHKDK